MMTISSMGSDVNLSCWSPGSRGIQISRAGWCISKLFKLLWI